MLNIFFGEMPEAIYDTASYFNNTFLDSWIEEDFSRKVIHDIDRAKVLSPQAVDSRALGVIPVTGLSGGVKTLLLIDHMPKKIFNASTCGDNCAKWLLKIAKRHDEDITVNLHHIMDFGANKFDIRIANTGEVVKNMGELILAAGMLLGEGDVQ
ncbi:MAG: DUF4869 domain-containing protein [Oscillospiraceae bacterium]|nr:DUF4869 domain-containing protein [Oscillospiraceae bacterium]